MNGLRRKRQRVEEDTDINMVPIMNMFMVLIPFLLMSASFYHIKAINTSVPIHASGTRDGAEEKDKTVKVTVIVELKQKRIQITGTAPNLTHEALDKLAMTVDFDGSPESLSGHLAAPLQMIKDQYPASDTMVLVVDPKVTYDAIVRTMDVARKTGERDLFTNVVISGSLG